MIELTIARAQQGDETAFEQLYRQHAPWVLALTYRMSGDHALAHDLAQEVFVRLWQKIHQFKGDSSFKTWFKRLAVNVCINRLVLERKRSLRFERFDDVDVEELAARIPVRTTYIDLERSIARLPERARVVFVLHDVEGYKHTEIAELMNTATGTVKAQLHRARQLLQTSLGADT